MAEIRFLVHLIVIFQGTSQRSYRDTAIILDIGHYLYRTKNESLLKITVGNGSLCLACFWKILNLRRPNPSGIRLGRIRPSGDRSEEN